MNALTLWKIRNVWEHFSSVLTEKALKSITGKGFWSLSGEKGTEEHHGKRVLTSIMRNGYWSLSGEKGTEEHHGKWVLAFIRGMGTEEHHEK